MGRIVAVVQHGGPDVGKEIFFHRETIQLAQKNQACILRETR